jgi:DNA-binding NarL/FixJ family response regulator
VTIRVVIADDQPLLRTGFKALITSAGDLDVVGEAGDGREAVRLAKAARADVVLMDIRMPVLDGIAATRLITGDKDLSGVRVLILTTFEMDEYIYAALRGGASGFLLKDTEPSELVRAIRVVAGGEAVLSPSVTRRLMAEFAGLSNDDIATRLVVAPATAKTHVSRAMRKLGAHDRAQLVVLAYETGLVYPGHALAPPPPDISLPAGLRLAAASQM